MRAVSRHLIFSEGLYAVLEQDSLSPLTTLASRLIPNTSSNMKASPSLLCLK